MLQTTKDKGLETPTWKLGLSCTFIKYKESDMSFVVPSFSLEFYTIFNLKCSFDLIFQDYHFETHHKFDIPSALRKKKTTTTNKQVLNC